MAERILLEEGTRALATERAAALLREGSIVLLPTEGVYGYHALSGSAGVARLEALKPRDSGKGWIALVARPADAFRWARSVPASALALMHAHWPGPLTLVLEGGPSVPVPLLGPGGTVALRCPGSDFLRGVLLATGGLVISTSANPPGQGAPSKPPGPGAEPQGVSLVVDAGHLTGSPSTVVQALGEQITVLREGAIRLRGSALDAPPGGP